MLTRIGVIDYQSGNLHSVAKALQASGADVLITSNPSDLDAVTHLVLPGVGAFAACIQGLKGVAGMVDALQEQVLQAGKPFLGICVGMQLMADTGLEHGTHQGLGWLGGTVQPLQVSPPLKIPHMGWNTLHIQQPHALLSGLGVADDVYFTHSYHLQPQQAEHVLATVDYGQSVVAMVGHHNIAGTQFHPEKSQRTGLRILENFAKWRP